MGIRIFRPEIHASVVVERLAVGPNGVNAIRELATIWDTSAWSDSRKDTGSWMMRLDEDEVAEEYWRPFRETRWKLLKLLGGDASPVAMTHLDYVEPDVNRYEMTMTLGVDPFMVAHLALGATELCLKAKEWPETWVTLEAGDAIRYLSPEVVCSGNTALVPRLFLTVEASFDYLTKRKP